MTDQEGYSSVVKGDFIKKGNFTQPVLYKQDHAKTKRLRE
ncbi:MAG: hypothetical protein JWP12_963 [Bacteroidetes bacterium]|nr:hypothetical protein [Bacteroidota bacterium]